MTVLTIPDKVALHSKRESGRYTGTSMKRVRF